MFLGKKLTIVDSVKDLGVIMDKQLSFNEHTDALASEVIGKLVMISRIRHLFDKSTLFIVINSFIFSKLFYCSSVWSGTSKSNIAKLQQVQNFAARLLSGKKKYEHITPTLKELRLLPVNRGGAIGGCGGVEHPPTRQWVGKLLSQSAKLDWLMITPEQTEMDNILNIWQKGY